MIYTWSGDSKPSGGLCMVGCLVSNLQAFCNILDLELQLLHVTW